MRQSQGEKKQVLKNYFHRRQLSKRKNGLLTSKERLIDIQRTVLWRTKVSSVIFTTDSPSFLKYPKYYHQISCQTQHGGDDNPAGREDVGVERLFATT